jgi:hypothetical protein
VANVDRSNWTDAQKRGRRNKMFGKAQERAVLPVLSRFFGQPFHRNPDSGVKVADVESADYVVEVKAKSTNMPAFLVEAFGQMEAAMAATGKQGRVCVTWLVGRKRRYFVMEEVTGYRDAVEEDTADDE